MGRGPHPRAARRTSGSVGSEISSRQAQEPTAMRWTRSSARSTRRRRPRFSGTAVRQAVLLRYGDDPEIEPGALWVRVLLNAGLPEE